MKNIRWYLVALIFTCLFSIELQGQVSVRRPGKSVKSLALTSNKLKERAPGFNNTDKSHEELIKDLTKQKSTLDSLYAVVGGVEGDVREATLGEIENTQKTMRNSMNKLLFGRSGKNSKEYNKALEDESKLFRNNVDSINLSYVKNLSFISQSEALKIRGSELTLVSDIYSRESALIFERFTNGGFLINPTGFKRVLSRYYFSGRTDKGVEILQNNFFNINTEIGAGSIYSELVAGYLGPFRLSLGGMVSTSELRSITPEELDDPDNLNTVIDEIRKENNQKLTSQSILSGGGNGLVNLTMPLAFYKTRLGDLVGSLSLFARTGFLLPEIGTASEDTEISTNIGLVWDNWMDLNAEGVNNSLALVFRATIQKYGNKENTLTILGREDRKSFWFSELSVGFDINSQFRVAFNYPVLMTDYEGDNPFPATISLNLIPFK